MNVAEFDFSILLPAFVAGVLVTATHVPLGIQVLNRGIVFIDLAIAQIAGCGVLVADGALVVYDAQTFKEIKRLPMSKPVGKYNVWNKITRSEGTSH